MGLNSDFEVGDIVQIQAGRRKNVIGTVVEIKDKKYHIHVKLHNGVIYSYHPNSIKIIGGITMNQENFKKVAVIPVGSKNCFFALYDDLFPGDSVLVSGVSEGKILVISEVISPEEANKRFGKKILQEVVCRVSYDTSAYEARIAKRNRTAELRKQMDERVAMLNEDRKYEMFVSVDDEMRRLYEEYKELIKGEK